MAHFELKFLDLTGKEDFIKVEKHQEDNIIVITGENDDMPFTIWLDKSTAIKFAKTLRTEINKII